jgi:hypothetical protein
MANLVVSAVSTWDNSGLKKGQKSLSAFDKSINRVGKSLLTVFGASALINYSKNAVKAFAEDEAAAKSLQVQLQNTGYAFASPGIELYIDNLQKLTGVLDDQLRPALQTLLTASGSLINSQKALAIALDVSAATGKSVEEVSAAIAKGYTGQTTALSRLGAGISKTTLATGDMNKILDEVSNKFSGQAKARLTTYAGKMDLLQLASANVAETIGKGILDALTLLGKDKNLENATTKMENFGTFIADAILGLGVLLEKLNKIGDNKYLKVLALSIEYSPVGLLSKLGESERLKSSSVSFQSLSATPDDKLIRKKELDIIKKAAAARAAELALLNKKNEVDKLKDKFDVERIGLTAALNAATDEETKLRIKAQIAILNNNEALAKKYNAELNAANSAAKLSQELTSTADAMAKLRIVTQEDYTKQMYAGSSIYYNGGGNAAPVPMGSASAGTGTTNNDNSVTLNVPGGIVDSEGLLSTVQEALQRLNKQGSPTYAAGQ